MKSLAFFLLLLVSGPAFSFNFGDLNMDSLSSEITAEKKELGGRWKSGHKWKGYLCQGEYAYDTGVQGILDELKMQVVAEGAAEVRAEMVQVKGDAAGSFRSSATLCYPFHMGIKFLIDRVSVVARASIKDEGLSTKIQVTVVSTRFGTIHFGKALSPTIENFITRLANSAFHWVWNSRVGTWLSQRISDEINKHTK